MLNSKIAVAAIVMTSVLFTGSIHFESFDFAYGQFFENSETTDTNSSDFSLNSTQLDQPNTADIVLLSQKLKKASFGYRDLVGQVKNIGNDTADFVSILLTVYGKDGGVIGTDSTYAEADTLRPGQKSTFKMFVDSDNFKGMDYYELSLQWDNPDGIESYVENAQLYKDNSTRSDNDNDND
jgi:hypothetical protein